MEPDEQSVAPPDHDLLELTLEVAPDVPRRVMASYARLWQLETWLRQMVYVELRAAFGNSWQQQVAALPGHTLANDLRLTHMPTPEQNPISYVTFSVLLKTVANNWKLFEPYLPPQNLWASKLEEVSQIRNRVAHFRLGHGDDLDRVLRFLRDIDQGFWKFCTSYNREIPVLPPTRDPVVKRFHPLNQFPFVEVEKRKWAMSGTVGSGEAFTVAINAIRRPWRTTSASGRISGQEGYLYDVNIRGLDRRGFDYRRFLQDTQHLHGDVVHICLESFNTSIRITIPAVLGARRVSKTIQRLIDWAPNSLQKISDMDDRTAENERLAQEWPEYVLGPGSPLCFLTSDMPCSFFSV
ncbi:Swt1 family HEPN domain-containing protein [Micromonospora sp. NPDC048830]|uniref:Swt1 family HEPN domain-containing protein n=1 Tax=Micromonospora sp. NPDC048830 TaxID=3364257 RepID=UPI00371CFABD